MSNLAHNFKIGDKVRCVDNAFIEGNRGTIYIGDVFTVIDINSRGDCIFVNNAWYAITRFELAEELSKYTDMPKYVIVEAKNKEFLEQVNELIAKGYKPQGGVVVDQQFYIQALVLGD